MLSVAGACSKVIKIVSGTYTGNGNASRKISVGFTPKAVLVMPQGYDIVNSKGDYSNGGLATTNCPSRSYYNNGDYDSVKIVSGGFNVYCDYEVGVYSNDEYIFNYVAWA